MATSHILTSIHLNKLGFNKHWAMKQDQIDILRDSLSNTNLWSQIGAATTTIISGLFNPSESGFFTDKSNYLLSCVMFPCDMLDTIFKNMTPILQHVTCGGVDIKDSSNNYVEGFNVGDGLLGNYPKYGMGTFNFTTWGTEFYEYAPYTEIELWLPYYGFVKLDLNLVIGYTIAIQYQVNYFDGSFTWYILRRYSDESSQTVLSDVILQGSGKMGIVVPISGVNGAEVLNKRLSNLTNIGTNLISGANAKEGDYSAMGGLAKNLSVDIIASKQTHPFKTSTEIGALAFWYAPQKPYIIKTKSKIVNTDYTALKGIPSGKMVDLDDFSNGDFVKVESVHMDGFTTAMKDEVDEIERLLKDGIII